jgi:hypothetical protein
MTRLFSNEIGSAVQVVGDNVHSLLAQPGLAVSGDCSLVRRVLSNDTTLHRVNVDGHVPPLLWREAVRHEPSLYLQLVHGTLSPLDCPIIEDTDLSSDISIGKGRLQGEADPLTWSSAVLVLYLIWTEQLFLYRNNLLVFDRLNEKLLEFG